MKPSTRPSGPAPRSDDTLPRETPGPQTPDVRLTPRQRELAIQYGVKARSRLGPGAQWSDAEPSLRAGWSALEATTQLGWEQARATVEEGWSLRGSHQRR